MKKEVKEKWDNAVDKILDNENEDNCPFCNDGKLHYYSNIDVETELGSLLIWCDKCKKAYFIGSIYLDDVHKTEKIPEDIIIEN